MPTVITGDSVTFPDGTVLNTASIPWSGVADLSNIVYANQKYNNAGDFQFGRAIQTSACLSVGDRCNCGNLSTSGSYLVLDDGSAFDIYYNYTQCNCACDCACACKIICTKLHSLGLMSKEIYLADQAFGIKLLEKSPDIYNGYRAWAQIVVDWMDGKGPKIMPWMEDKKFSTVIKKWSTSWAYDIATPWAEEMAYKMGVKSEGSLTGKLVTMAGVPICKFVGVWQRIFGKKDKPAGFMTGISLLLIFIFFKMIVKIGRFFEKLNESLVYKVS